jgi:transposase
MACRATLDPTGQQADGIMELKEFGTMTVDLLTLSDWLAAAGITYVAMESTSEYRKIHKEYPLTDTGWKRGTVVACVRRPGKGRRRPSEVRTFETTTAALWTLADGLTEQGVTLVAMESTGVFWKPVFNLLEGNFQVLLVNAAHVKRVPGRKTDKAESRWLAKLMRHGLLQASFILPQGQRERRDLTRYRTKVVQERSREGNRVPGVLERANIKLAAVATDIMGGRPARSWPRWSRAGADPATMAELATGRRRSMIPLLAQALTGRMRDHYRRLLTMQLAHIDFLGEQIATLSAEITGYLTALEPGDPPVPPTDRPCAASEAERAAEPDVPGTPLSFARAVTVLDTIPGVAQRGAELLVVEWGTDMQRFGTASRLSAWMG